jgi:Peptidase family M28
MSIYPSFRPKRSLRRPAILAGILASAMVVIGACVSQPLVSPRPPIQAASCDPARLERHVRMLAETLHPRGHEHVANLDRAAAYLGAELTGSGGTVSEQAYDVRGRTYRNVLARFGPESGARVVVGAHYDAADDHPGADDNASGVAGLLELARLLGQARPGAPVELVAYTLEEPPYFRTEQMGSARHARSLKEAGARVRAMISLEMIGYFSDEPGSQSFPVSSLGLLYPSTGNFIAVVGDLGQTDLVREVKGAMKGATDLPVYSLNAPATVQGIDWSDHRSYWAHGYHAVMITDTSYLRNRAYHTDRDTPETLDYVRMGKTVEGVFQAVMALATP